MNKERCKEVVKHQMILDEAKRTLNKEFVGLDKIIEEIIDGVSSWFLFPEIQDKPVIINLWGLTGVGKSSLVKRLSEMLDFQQRYYHFDLKEGDESRWVIKSKLEDIFENDNGYPIIMALDEFQHARTLDELGKEKDSAVSPIIWQLLDSGKFQVSRYSHYLEDIYNLTLKLRYLLNNGVEVNKGKVVSRKEYFTQNMYEEFKYGGRDQSGKSQKKDGELDYFVPKSFHEPLYSVVREEFPTLIEFKNKLLELEGHETIAFLSRIFKKGNSPKTVDCSISLIFVMGNLDEAYTMSDNFNPDMSADEFHEQSLKIKLPKIKQVLRKRFRSEQIARLGNNHIIYPAFSSNSFKKLISLELDKIHRKTSEHFGLNLHFDNSITQQIYKEGVYPTQGTRPLFTTIHSLINTKLGKILSEISLKKLVVTDLVFKAKKSRIQIDFLQGKQQIHKVTFLQQLCLESLREDKRDDLQAITAVHEAGHAILSIVLLNTLPEVIFSNSAADDLGGLVLTKFKWRYISKKEIVNRLAMYLGGIAAEKLIFGEENVTVGSENDLVEATQFITAMLRECGMGEVPGSYNTRTPITNHLLHDEANKITIEAESWLSKAMVLAENTLQKQELLLLKMADYLSDNRKMDKMQIRKMCSMYAKNYSMSSIIENGDHLFYRRYLKDKAQEVSKKKKRAKTNPNLVPISLNKKDGKQRS